MRKQCSTTGCNRLRREGEDYCIRCFRMIEDLSIQIIETPRELRLFEFTASCGICPNEQYGLMLTRTRARQLCLAGIRCGNCRNAFMILEELTGTARNVA